MQSAERPPNDLRMNVLGICLLKQIGIRFMAKVRCGEQVSTLYSTSALSAPTLGQDL